MSHLHEFEGPIEGYCVNWLTQHGWKFEPYHQRSDMLQNAYIVFLRCATRYPDVSAPHFMSLFKTAWDRETINLAKKVSKDRDHTRSATMTDRESSESFTVEPVGDLENLGYLRLMVEQAPREVSMVLNLMLNAPVELLEMAVAALKRKDRRATEDEMVQTLLGLPEGSEPVQAVRDYFSSVH